MMHNQTTAHSSRIPRGRSNPPAAPQAVEPFTVSTPWVRVAVPLKASVHAFFTTRKPLVQWLLGRDVHTASIGPHLKASAGQRDRGLEFQLLFADIHLAPAPRSRTQRILRLEMEARWWSMIEDLAAFYGTAPVAIVQACLVKRLESLRAFDRYQATGTKDPNVFYDLATVGR